MAVATKLSFHDWFELAQQSGGIAVKPHDAIFLEQYLAGRQLDLDGALLRSVRFERQGPGCIVRLDLPTTGSTIMQGHLGFLAVADVHLEGTLLPQRVTFHCTQLPESRIALDITGQTMRLQLSCALQFYFGKFSTHETSLNAIDDGAHTFASKLDQRLHTVVPGPEDGVYHGYF